MRIIRGKFNFFVILIFLLVSSLALKFQPLPDSSEILKIYYAHSIFSIVPSNLSKFVEFGHKQGFYFFWSTTFFLKLLFNNFAVRISLFGLCTFLFYKISKIIINKYALLSSLLFIISPWILFTSSYDIQSLFSLTLFLLFTFFYFKPVKNNYILYIFVVLLSGSSWQGFFFAAIFLLIKFIKQPNRVLFFLLFLIFFINLINRDFVKTSFQSSFLSEIAPQRLSQEINERQKIDFVSTNKKLILPSAVRKLIYNKPFLIFEKISLKFISFFDFEQFASPLDSYALITKSGIPPKNNFPLIYIWELPFLIYGIFVLVKKKMKPNSFFYSYIFFLHQATPPSRAFLYHSMTRHPAGAS